MKKEGKIKEWKRMIMEAWYGDERRNVFLLCPMLPLYDCFEQERGRTCV